MRRFLSNLVSSQNFPFYVTAVLFVLLFSMGAVAFEGFFSPQVFLNLFIDNAPLIIVTVGITFTIISGFGGIDLSVGAVV
ncbi:MAG: sugar ABC transporter permease YjfF, partial [Succinivibrio sp.]